MFDLKLRTYYVTDIYWIYVSVTGTLHFISSFLVPYVTYSRFAARLLRYIMLHSSFHKTKDVPQIVC